MILFFFKKGVSWQFCGLLSHHPLLFSFHRLLVEFPATGGALPSWQFHSVKLLRYVTYYDYFLASCEVIFCLFIFTFIIQEVIKMKKLKKEYFRDAWNWLDMLLLLVSLSIYMCFWKLEQTKVITTDGIGILVAEMARNSRALLHTIRVKQIEGTVLQRAWEWWNLLWWLEKELEET